MPMHALTLMEIWKNFCQKPPKGFEKYFQDPPLKKKAQPETSSTNRDTERQEPTSPYKKPEENKPFSLDNLFSFDRKCVRKNVCFFIFKNVEIFISKTLFLNT